MNDPLYQTGIAGDGKPLIGGIFRLKDECGFPMDMSYEITKEKGWHIDYLELLCDAWTRSNFSCLGFDTMVRELELLGGSHVESWKKIMTVTVAKFPKMMNTLSPINTACRYWLAKKRLNSRKINRLVIAQEGA